MRAACERASLACLALGAVVLAHALWPGDAARRAEVLSVGVLALGYGHLLGAAWQGAARLRARCPQALPPPLFAAWLAAGGLAALAAWSWAAPRLPGLTLALLAVSVWHTAENDLALFARGRLAAATPPRSKDPARRALALAWTLGLGVWATATPAWREGLGPAWDLQGGAVLRPAAAGAAAFAAWRGGRSVRLGAAGPLCIAALPAPPLALVDLFAASTLYHLLAWQAVLMRRIAALRRAGAGSAARRLGQRLALVHALPALACAGAAGLSAPGAEGLRGGLLSPGLYLFWSALHVVQTDLVRPRSPRAVGDTP